MPYPCKRCETLGISTEFPTAIELANHVRKDHPKSGKKSSIVKRLEALETAVFAGINPSADGNNPGIIASDGQTKVTEEMKARGKVVQTVEGRDQRFQVFEDPVTKTKWVETEYLAPPPWERK